MATIKKAQAGKVIDKTAVKKPDAVKIMKGDNEIAVRKQNNTRKIADYNRKMDVSAALMYGDENGSLLKDASKQDSISKSAVAKARSLRKNPKFKLKSGGSVKKAQNGAKTSLEDKQATDMFNAAGKMKKPTVKKLPSDINKAFPKAKDGKWMQKASASIKKRGTEGVCTGAKFGGPTCKPGTKRYALAKTFRKISKKK